MTAMTSEDHHGDTNPERRAEEHAEKNASGGTTPVVNVGIESRRLDARHECHDADPDGNHRLGNSIRRHRAGCHITGSFVHLCRNAPMPASAPFHKACLERQWGARPMWTRNPLWGQ